MQEMMEQLEAAAAKKKAAKAGLSDEQKGEIAEHIAAIRSICEGAGVDPMAQVEEALGGEEQPEENNEGDPEGGGAVEAADMDDAEEDQGKDAKKMLIIAALKKKKGME